MSAPNPIIVFAGREHEADHELQLRGWRRTAETGRWESDDGRCARMVRDRQRLYGTPRGSEYVVIGSFWRNNPHAYELTDLAHEFGLVEISHADLGDVR